MTQEYKELLLKDICSRFPYNVRVEYNGTTLTNVFDVLGIAHGRIVLCLPFMSKTECPLIEDVKPYLFPMSSITKDIEDEIYHKTGLYDIFEYDQIHIEDGGNFEDICKLFEILNKHHLDYRGLIPKNLAIDATGLNIY